MKEKVLNAIKAVAKTQQININLAGDSLDKEFKELGIDSISVFKTIIDVENAVGFQLDDDQLMKIKTINQLIAAFEAKANK
ncbi:MAG: phosphopantetheine-binding protein [Mycoplasmoidaceae bacterium]|nr:phosphopantetheine-binding protein [Mycoplasmoidaceae bacterium]